MSVIIFKSDDNIFSVEFTHKILNNIHQECIKSKNEETGGILIGKYSVDRNNAIINNITGPPKGSKQSRYAFVRGAVDLEKIIDKKKDFYSRYIGDWHFHPNSSPEPSIVDDIQMKKFANDYKLNCHEPILLIIGGNQNKGWNISVHVYTKDLKITLIKVTE